MTGDDMKKMLLIAIITMLATMGLFAVDPATATFDITAVKDYGSDKAWAPSFSYVDLYGSVGDELLDGREIEINPAQLNPDELDAPLDLFRVNYITNDSKRQVTMTVTTKSFSNESAENVKTIDVTYHFSDAVYVKDDDSAEWETYSPQSGSDWGVPWSDTKFIQTIASQSSVSGSSYPYEYESPSLARTYDYGILGDRGAALPYDSVKYSLTVAVSFSNEMNDDALKNLAGTYKLPVTVTITSED